MKTYKYQLNFSADYQGLYNSSQRQQKANKILSIIKDYCGETLEKKVLLDVGSSTGIMTNLLSKHFKKTIGVDIDQAGVQFAKKNFKRDSLQFLVQDSMKMEFNNNTFDIVNCSHVYEHVPDSKKMFKEIFRVLKPGGVCFFAAGNRLNLIENHYQLPLLSVIPKRLAHIYLKILKVGDYYYENHLTYWGLKKLVSDFHIIDYTQKIIETPGKYFLDDMIKDKSFKQKIALMVIKHLYFLSPTYIWILKKPN
jgi:ubiquinone/menaquinone biosynthesis C-methylase UbiE